MVGCYNGAKGQGVLRAKGILVQPDAAGPVILQLAEQISAGEGGPAINRAGTYSVSHRIRIPAKPWPVQADGRDVSWWKNNDFGFNKSYFVFGRYEDFRGGYWHDSDFGYGHYALHDDIPGQKIWIWSLAREGAMWEDILTDGHGQHLESQNGRLLNQNDHMFFTPYTADYWREVWFPYKKTGGMVKANPYGVLNVTRVQDGIKISFCPLQKTDDDLSVTAEGKEIFRKHLKLEPMEVYEQTVASDAKKGTLQVKLAEKIKYCDDPNADIVHRPYNFHEFKGDTIQDTYLAAENLQKRRDYAGLWRNIMSVWKRSRCIHRRFATSRKYMHGAANMPRRCRMRGRR